MNTLYSVLGILFLWSLWGYFSSKVEHLEYSVLESKEGYEIRLYPKHIVAQTIVTGSYRESLTSGFRIIAGYIFGGNTKKENIAMTAPVTQVKNSSQRIAMTAPVTASLDGESHTISFSMPRSYTMDTLPIPSDSRVEIVTIPSKKMAVSTFSWIRTDSRVEFKKKELVRNITRDGIRISGELKYAGYNAPWTPPWMTRNEVLVEVFL
jgi:effector-binding domain-containing protein